MLFTYLFSIHFQIGYVFIIKHRSLNIEDEISIDRIISIGMSFTEINKNNIKL